MTRRSPRTEIAASALASGARPSEVARELGMTRGRASAIGAANGIASPRGRPASAAVTGNTARGRALLARAVELAEAAKVEPEALLEAGYEALTTSEQRASTRSPFVTRRAALEAIGEEPVDEQRIDDATDRGQW